jgi:hypothetical protein
MIDTESKSLEFLGVMRAKQMELGLTNVAFARLLGMPIITWGKILAGEKQIGARTARRYLAQFPEDREHVIRHLVDGTVF